MESLGRELEVHNKRWDMDGWMTDKERKVKRSQESPEGCCVLIVQGQQRTWWGGVHLLTRAGQGEAQWKDPRYEEHL